MICTRVDCIPYANSFIRSDRSLMDVTILRMPESDSNSRRNHIEYNHRKFIA